VAAPNAVGPPNNGVDDVLASPPPAVVCPKLKPGACEGEKIRKISLKSSLIGKN
jgi:hypothetical protein